MPGCAHILDDFLFVCSSEYDSCLEDLNKFFHVTKVLGIPINHDKTVLPTTTITFVGIEIDSVLMEKKDYQLINLRKLGTSYQVF